MNPTIPEALPRGIRRLPNGRYRVRSGRRDLRAKTYAEALELYASLHERPADFPTHERLAEYLERWLGRRMSLAPSTRRKYADNIRAYVRGYPIARRRVDTLTPLDFEAYFRSLAGHVGTVTGRPLRPTSIVAVRRMLNAALSDAVRTGGLSLNPVALAQGPRLRKVRKDPPTAVEVARILAELRGHRLEALYQVAAATGARKGELLALRWSDLELEGDLPLIRIRATLESVERTLSPTKTAGSRRDIPIGPEVVAILRAHHERQNLEARGEVWHNPYGLVFASRLGTPLDGGNILKWARAAIERSGVADERRARGMAPMTFHDFRHAFATHSVADGVPVAVLSRYLGHTSIATTADRYYHPTPADLAELLTLRARANEGANGGQIEPIRPIGPNRNRANLGRDGRN